ncbi:meiosis regulator and mRNA stability factor 1-like [Amphiura filiformis]|uniref:meiosis regulator and mRNA stability factor 1-like n=1 Tax=Amphiura filiformis TaxID=82378 RepID=UPI003B22831D
MSSANANAGLIPIQQFHSPQRIGHQCLQQVATHSICPNTSPLRHTIHPPSVCSGISPCRSAVICGNTLHQGIAPTGVNICSSPIRPNGANRSSNTVCSSSPLQQQARASGLDESMLSSISAIHLYQSPDKSCILTKDDKNNSSSSLDNPPPIGVFWDIENCAVPRGKSALSVAQRIRDRFFTGHREAEFMCVCDISKESPVVIQELNDAQVTVAHINATAKNAADDKLRQSLRRFADTHNPPATVVLISGDVNFAGNLSDLRHRNGIYVILVHGQEASEALRTCANESLRYHELVADLPFRSPAKAAIESNTLVVHNLPPKKDPHHVRNRLRQLSENCGGKVIHNSNNNAIIKFPNAESALRAKKRLEGEKVFGNKISISFPKNKPSSIINAVGRTNRSPRRDSSSSPHQQRQRMDSQGDKSSADEYSVNHEKAQTLPMQLPPFRLPLPPVTAPSGGGTQTSQQYQPSQILQQAIKQLNQQDFSRPIANLQSPTTHPSEQPGLGPGIPVNMGQQLGGKTQSPIEQPGLGPGIPVNMGQQLGGKTQSPIEQPGLGPGIPVNMGQQLGGKTQSPIGRTIANLQSPTTHPSEQPGLGPGIPVNMGQQLGGKTQSPIGTPREHQSPIGTPRSTAATSSNQYNYFFPPAPRPSSRPPSRTQSQPQSRTQSPIGTQHMYGTNKETGNQATTAFSGMPSNAQSVYTPSLAGNRLAAAFKPLESTTQRASPEIVVIGDDSRTNRGHFSARSSEDDRQSDSEVSMYWRQALKATGLLRATGDAPRASPPIPAGQLRGYPSNQHGTFKPIPQVQRLTPPVAGQSMWNRGDGVESPPLRGQYRVPSPMLANCKPKGWQYVPYQDQDPAQQGVELLITNLDHQMPRKDLKRHLVAVLSDHCKVLHLIFGEQYSGQCQAVVRVASMSDAIRVLGNVNRRQIGSRLLHVIVLPRSDSNADKLRLMIIPMLQEIPGMCLPLYKFKAAFETRYQQQLYVADLYQINDTVTIRDSNVGKLVCLTTSSRASTPNSSGYNSPASRQSPVPFMPPKDPTPEPCEEFCSIHDTDTEADIDARNTDPLVVISLRTLSAQVHTLLQLHDGRIPFISFPICYTAEFSPFVINPEQGVPLEHLITCIQGVRVGISRDGFKTVCWSQTRTVPENETGQGNVIQLYEASLSGGTPLLPTQLFQFSKEAVELLKHSPRCRLAFSKFIPAYHHHFGRQCRVADYGYLKLVELFEAISHVLQILGATENKLLVLTHRAQVKRFSQDLLKVLKSQASKEVSLQEFSSAYHRTFGRPFEVVDYGVCDVQDLLIEVPEGMLTVSWNGDDTKIFIPRREQTADELVKMKKFGREVADLLSRQPRFRIPFSKFIPAYHHFFGHQCRVAEYGFNKLAELFDALSDVVLVEEQGEDRMVTLTGPERVSAVARLTSMLLHKNRQLSFPLEALMHNYTRAQGYPVSLQDFGVDKARDLVAKFPYVVEVKVDCGEQWLHLVEQTHLSQLAQQVLVVLLEAPDGQLSLNNFPASYYHIWEQWLVPTEYGYSKMVLLLKTLHHVILVRDEWGDTCTVQLTPTYQFARRARSVLLAQHDSLALTMQDFVTRYQRMNKSDLQPSDFGHTTLASLVCSVPRVLSLMGKGYRRIVTLNPCCLGPSRKSRTIPGTSLKTSSDRTCSPADMSSTHETGQDNVMSQPGSRTGDGRNQLTGPTDLSQSKMPSTSQSSTIQPDAVPRYEEDLIDFGCAAVDIPDLLSTSEIEQVTRKFTMPTRSLPTSHPSASANATSFIPEHNVSSRDSATHADSGPTDRAASRESCSPSSGDWGGRPSSESPTASSAGKSPRKTPRKCKLAVNFSVPMSK